MTHQLLSPMKYLWIACLALVMLPMGASAADNFAIVLQDSFGRPLTGKSVEVLVELTTGAMDGQVQYAENHSVKSDSIGVISLAIGRGKATDPKYVFDNFDIAQGDNYVRVLVQEAGSWRLLVKSQIPNVPKIRKWLFADEKSNTVIAVMIVVWLGIVVYLLLSGRKVGRLEKQLAELQQRQGQKS